MLYFSRIGFNKKRTRGIVIYITSIWSTSGNKRLALLEKIDGKWFITKVITLARYD